MYICILKKGGKKKNGSWKKEECKEGRKEGGKERNNMHGALKEGRGKVGKRKEETY